jgi:crotonobetainyl-CoA:carnitine CoA-transferase CaiB-like acyl-CoA transferase
MPGPLAGVRVLDLTTVVLGPYATQLLAELGAEVIKLEPLDGDNMRHVGEMRHPGMGHIHLNLNRGKRSLALDLKKPAAREAALRLATRADVLISNVRPAAMKRLGLGYEDVAARNPRIIYVSACGFSQRGPYADKPAYDDLIQGATAIPWLMERYGEPEPCYAPVLVGDRVTGLHTAFAVSAALFARERNGAGQAIEVPMFESVAQFVLGDHSGGHTFVPPIGEPGYTRLVSRDRRPYRTKDGWLCVLIYNDKHWKNFFAAIGDPERYQRDERFSTHAARGRNIGWIYAWVGETMRTRTTAEWRALFDAADIPNQPINSPQDLLDDPHFAATGFVREEDHPTEGRLRALGVPSGWSATPPGLPSPARRLGEDSRACLREAGLSDAEIDALAADGAAILGDR